MLNSCQVVLAGRNAADAVRIARPDYFLILFLPLSDSQMPSQARTAVPPKGGPRFDFSLLQQRMRRHIVANEIAQGRQLVRLSLSVLQSNLYGAPFGNQQLFQRFFDV